MPLSESLDYLTGPPVDEYPDGSSYEMTVSQIEGEPSDTWFPVTLGADGRPRLLIGPNSDPTGPGRLSRGRWFRFLRVTPPGGPTLPVVPPAQGWETSAMDFLGNAVRSGDRLFIPFRSNTKAGALGIAEVV